MHNFLEVFVIRNASRRSAGGGSCPRGGILHFFHSGDSDVDGFAVHIDDIVALLAIRLLDGSFHVLDCIGLRDDAGNFEECSLQDMLILPPKPTSLAILTPSIL